MSLTITLPDYLSEQVEIVARLHKQSIVELVEAILSEALDGQLVEMAVRDNQSDLLTENSEMAAYLQLHPLLKKTHFGEYVAIFQGKLIDHDREHSALYRRIDQRYPDDYVWISKVEEEPIKELRFLSPRFESGK